MNKIQCLAITVRCVMDNTVTQFLYVFNNIGCFRRFLDSEFHLHGMVFIPRAKIHRQQNDLSIPFIHLLGYIFHITQELKCLWISLMFHFNGNRITTVFIKMAVGMQSRSNVLAGTHV